MTKHIQQPTRRVLRVTVYLYLCPNNRARSLSTLMAADTREDAMLYHQGLYQRFYSCFCILFSLLSILMSGVLGCLGNVPEGSAVFRVVLCCFGVFQKLCSFDAYSISLTGHVFNTLFFPKFDVCMHE